MKQYEMVREIFNSCSNNQMRDVFIKELQTDDVDAWVTQFLSGAPVAYEKHENSDGSIWFDIDSDGLRQRITFTRLDGGGPLTPSGAG
ncbi:MAG: hypothetical protein LBD74_04275 [Spirochaetaceae bacterium]|jgi:hypothetical protein|nr:hypothetical protein [Spirochaetaceae bacterium]